MSKSNIMRARCEFLFGARLSGGAGYGATRHTHPFWQLEIVRTGLVRAGAEGRRYDLRPGHLFMIAPGTVHWFHYLAKKSTALTFRFGASGIDVPWPASHRERTRETDVLGEALSGALPPSGDPGRVARRLLDDLLTAAAHLFLGGGADERGVRTSELIEDVERIVTARQGRPVSVSEIASELGRSPGHVSAQFRRRAGMSLKRYLDRQRAAMAARLLTYADMSAGEIADRMAFPDQFTFSKFCKRTLGASPREFRLRALHGRQGG